MEETLNLHHILTPKILESAIVHRTPKGHTYRFREPLIISLQDGKYFLMDQVDILSPKPRTRGKGLIAITRKKGKNVCYIRPTFRETMPAEWSLPASASVTVTMPPSDIAWEDSEWEELTPQELETLSITLDAADTLLSQLRDDTEATARNYRIINEKLTALDEVLDRHLAAIGK